MPGTDPDIALAELRCLYTKVLDGETDDADEFRLAETFGSLDHRAVSRRVQARLLGTGPRRRRSVSLRERDPKVLP